MFGNPMYAGMGASRVIEPTAPPVEFITEQVTYARMAWYAYRLTAEGIDHFTIDGYTLVDIPRLGPCVRDMLIRRVPTASRNGWTHAHCGWQGGHAEVHPGPGVPLARAAAQRRRSRRFDAQDRVGLETTRYNWQR